MRFKIDWASLIVGRRFTVFALLLQRTRSKGFATLRNVSKLTFLGQDWARKVGRFSVIFGYLTKSVPNKF